MPTVTIRPGAGDEETIPATVGYEHTRELGKMRRLLIDVERSQAQAVTLNPKADAIQLGSLDPVRLVDIETGGATWTLVCYSFEWDANREPFTDGGNLREGTDDTLVTNLVNEVATWSAGTITNFSGPLSFVFSHAHQHEALRRIERNVTGEIQFRDSGTVDYINRLGTDKSATVELSASAGTIEDRIRITERGRELDGTHFRVLGAHEGEAQLFVNLVPDGDSGNYENEVTYTTSRWSSPSDTDWDRWENKDVTDQATLEEEAANLAEEITESLVEVVTRTSTADVSIGDTVQVVKPDADLDRAMRVHRIQSKGGARNDSGSSAAVVDHLLLSTRTTARPDTAKDLRSIRQFNTGFQGTSVTIQGGGSRQPVDSGINAQIPFNYPNIAFENEAELQVRGLPYRAYSSGAGTESNFVTQIDVSRDLPSETTLAPGDDTTFTAGITSTDYNGYFLFFKFVLFTDGSDNELEVVIRDDFGFSLFEEIIKTSELLGDFVTIFPVTELTMPEAFDITIQNPSSASSSVTLIDPTRAEIFSPQHQHDVEPGVQNFGSETPTGVDVIIDGNTVATDIGTGTFETTVDISGELTQDAWNLIELTSSTIGHIQGTLSIDGYKQIGKQP
ncbi:hypothetical protein OSG_eHP27_00060 [environmental Halophage eHP-27]|nr:hypothetical protein OSG_eHP27_00060 [environmental Halophage eHP-27]